MQEFRAGAAEVSPKKGSITVRHVQLMGTHELNTRQNS